MISSEDTSSTLARASSRSCCRSTHPSRHPRTPSPLPLLASPLARPHPPIHPPTPLQLRSNHVGIRYRTTLMFETTSLGAVLPSYDVETRTYDDERLGLQRR
jgi:hypothetical protein